MWVSRPTVSTTGPLPSSPRARRAATLLGRHSSGTMPLGIVVNCSPGAPMRSYVRRTPSDTAMIRSTASIDAR
jgi:hypothetical protein